MKLWSGRFQKETNEELNDFNSSTHIDSRMYKEDIEGSIAHVIMISNCGIISGDEGDLIVEGLQNILKKIENNEINFSKNQEDIHMNIETLLIQEIGEIGKKLHTARSRNDQVALDTRMYIKKQILEINKLILEFQKVLSKKIKENINTIMPGYTHMQRAQPITFAHHLLAYSEMFKRDYERLEDCYKRVNTMPLGSGALATTTYPINRVMVKELLKFNRLSTNSIDAVSDRDFILELASNISIIMMHLSRFSEEVILWCSSEFSFIELDDAYSTGSSIMPQKKNPDVAELVRGKCGRVYGNLVGLLSMMKSLPLAYNKDMQEDKELIFDSIDTLKICISIFSGMVDTLKVKKENMKNACKDGFINATDLADYLVKKGVAFRDAHKITGELVYFCIENNKILEELTIEEMRKFSQSFQNDVYEYIDIELCVENRKVIGGPSSIQTKERLEELNKYIYIKENLLEE
ncbi:argininosuccinate lyase [Clostridium mediterraneense]|uniref:argininosuccinate lyase n=1 Tax=Clostridium mediterraneense TaxID=1805472 RepID=UPI000837244F|nr:argininosuccinate lyase [Clostridium mediterraneense]